MKKNIDDINFEGKRTFIRCDFNVPLDDNLNITNDLRIVNSLPTIKKVLNDNGKVILASHMGRPKGEFNEKLSLAPVAKRLSELLNLPVQLLSDCVGKNVEDAVNAMQNGEVILLENVRFHKEETSKDEEVVASFSKEFAKLADVFVCDAFGSAHRAHASVVGLANNMEAVAGYLMNQELNYFDQVLNSKNKTIAAIIGGAKVSDKIQLITNLLSKVDKLVIGGAMAYTFQHALGRDVGASLLEKDHVSTALNILEQANDKHVKIYLPVDTLIADDFSNDANIDIIDASSDIPKEWEGVDIGPKSVEVFSKALEDVDILVWNGPVGVFEKEKFANGTKDLASKVAESNATTIIGGGDTAAAVFKFNYQDKMSHISTGGGASLELLEGKTLPGVACLTDK